MRQQHIVANTRMVSNFGAFQKVVFIMIAFIAEVAIRSFHGQERESPYKRKTGVYQPWSKYNYPLRDAAQPVAQPQPPKPPPPVSASLVALDTSVTAAAAEPEWIVKSGCHSSCMAKSKGIQVVTSRRTGANNIQLCTHTAKV